MKISNSKKELARIISENGGWLGGVFSVQNGEHGRISFSENKPSRHGRKSWMAEGGFKFKIEVCKPTKNWHQTILSREEYFFLHQNQGLEDALDEPMVEAKPTIEQLASDYRNAKDYADRKRQEADAAKADADARLKALEVAGDALGLKVSQKEPDLVITDWRDLRVGDVIEVTGSSNEWWQSVKGKELTIKIVRSDGASTGEWLVRGNTEFRLVRRP